MSILLHADLIHQHLIAQKWLSPLAIEVLPCIASTNDYLKSQLKVGNVVLPRVCLAEQQTQGRGQLQKIWHSPYAENIYCSYAFMCNQSLAALQGLSLVVGMAVIEALRNYAGLHDLKIKWPNDVYWQNKKLAGILVETLTDGSFLHVVIGIGINVNMTQSNIDQPWTSLKCILQAEQDRNKIMGVLIPILSAYLERFLQQTFSVFMPQWAQYDYLYGKALLIEGFAPDKVITAAGINQQGHLLLRDAQGNVQPHISGSVRQR